MNAPSADAHTGTKIAGQQFNANGLLAGHQQAQTVLPTNGAYLIRVPPASAVLLVR
jgi:hypothetical protein